MAQVNGERPQSATVDHLTKYPLVSQSVDFVQKQPIGAKSIELANNVYSKASPYLATPASYVAPYASKVDSIGDSGLNKIDARIPALKETDYGTLYSYATWPFNYVFSTYQDEYSKTAKRDGDSLFSTGKAIFSTELRIASESLHYIADFFGPQKDKAVDEYEKLKKTGNEKAQQAKKTADANAQQAKKVANEKKDQFANGSAS